MTKYFSEETPLNVAAVLSFGTAGCGLFGENNDSNGDEEQIVTDGAGIDLDDKVTPETPPAPQPPPPPPTTPALAVTATTPANGAMFVPTGVVISVTFSQNLDPATVNNNNVKLFDNTNTEVLGTVSLNNNVISLTPSAALANGTSYSVTVSAVKDTEGDALETPYTFGFTTRIKLLPPVFDPPVVIFDQCPGNFNDDFEVGSVRAVFYTARVDDAGTNGEIRLAAIGGGEPGYSDRIVTGSEASQNGALEQGNLYSTRSMVIPANVNLRSMDFKAMKIELNNGDGWYLGGMVVQVLKKGCLADQDSNWTTVYFNPYVRTLISSSKPLTVSYDDAVAVFHTKVWDIEDAGTDDDVYGGTPFETKSSPLYGMKDHPQLGYGDTDDFERGHTGYYGRTYFAVEQVDRLHGSFSSLMPQDVSAGFKVLFVGRDDVDFHTFQAYLLQPVYKGGAQPLTGYQSKSFYGWLGGCPSWPQACAGPDPEVVLETNTNRNFYNLGEEPSEKTPKGFLRWMSQHDDPGQ